MSRALALLCPLALGDIAGQALQPHAGSGGVNSALAISSSHTSRPSREVDGIGGTIGTQGQNDGLEVGVIVRMYGG